MFDLSLVLISKTSRKSWEFFYFISKIYSDTWFSPSVFMNECICVSSICI